MPDLAILLSFSGRGGVERMIVNLIDGFDEAGVQVDLLAIRADGARNLRLPPHVHLIDLGTGHTHLALPAVAGYLSRSRPRALLAAKDRAIRVAALARRIARTETRLAGRLGTNLSAALAGKPAWQGWLRRAPMRLLYRWVDHVVAVSEGVAEDTQAITGLPASSISIVRNPVITPRMAELAALNPGHPWLTDGQPPVILGAGRLTRQKDFCTLLRAFARLREARQARLIVLGDGQQRRLLESTASKLGVAEDVDLPGYAANPYAYMARARLFVLSSAWEGSPNVLAEALALGVPAVSTDCPSGPRELLEGGRFGRLVPVGDHQALAEAMLATLEAPLPPEVIRQAAADYTLEASTRGYLRVLGLGT